MSSLEETHATRSARPATPSTRRETQPARTFNMVEIALAVAVIGIGIAGIVALFPIGMNASRDAIAESYAADTSEQFLHMFAGMAKNNWSALTAWPDNRPYVITGTESNNWTALAENGNIERHTVENGVFRVTQRTAASTDFEGVFRVWKSPLSYNYWDGSSWQSKSIDMESAVAINLEVSWPCRAPYAARQKSFFYLEVFRP